MTTTAEVTVPTVKTVDAAKAVAIAKDVLEQLKYLQLSTCTYVEVWDIYKTYGMHEGTHIPQIQVQAMTPLIRKNCRVCAIGAMVLSKANLYDQLSIRELFDVEDNVLPDEMTAERDPIVDGLSDAFTPEQVDLVECAYQCDTAFAASPSSVEARSAAHLGRAIRAKVKAEHPTANAQELNQATLTAIMENIIANNGVFVPPIPTDEEYLSLHDPWYRGQLIE